jgi:hypothetical protein
MECAPELYISRLASRGIPQTHIPALIQNVLRIIENGGLFTTKRVNEHLQELGWGEDVLDESSFQLIVSILESEWGYRVERYMIG